MKYLKALCGRLCEEKQQNRKGEIDISLTFASHITDQIRTAKIKKKRPFLALFQLILEFGVLFRELWEKKRNSE